MVRFFVDYTHLIAVLFSVLVTHAKLESELPFGWSSSCKVTPAEFQISAIYIQCDINSTDFILSLTDFREWSANQTQKYGVGFFCQDNSRLISLPWPMKARNLVGVWVDGCGIVDYKSEEFSTTILSIPDELLYLSIRNSQIKVKLIDMIKAQERGKLSKEIDCGQLTVRNYTMSGIKYAVDINTGMEGRDLDSDLQRLSKRILEEPQHITHTCNYTNLVYRDNSNSSDFSKHSLELLTHNAKFPNLAFYNLSSTGIPSIPRQLEHFRLFFPELKYLDLSHNMVTKPNFVDYKDDENKKLLINMQHNKIKTISASHINQMDYSKTIVIDFRNNPFECDCNLLTFQYFLQTSRIYERNKDFSKVKCYTPENMRGKMLIELDRSDLECSKSPLLVRNINIVIGLIITFIIMAGLFILTINFRQEIKILVFTRLHIMLPCNKIDASMQMKIYDAFISYSYLDEQWVMKTLKENLEKPVGHTAFRLCFHHRDFVVGAAIAENIVQSVEASRHTIMVLSKNFLRSEWCLMEFRTAFQQSLLERNRHLIIVVLEEVSMENLEADLRRCLKTFTYLRVPDRLFWDKLIYSLSCNN